MKKNDERIWMALGDTFTELDNLNYAKKAYKRAISCGGVNRQASIEKMARICHKLGLAKKTTSYWELFLRESEGMFYFMNFIASLTSFQPRQTTGSFFV